jgi:Surface antigen variable number repeat
MRRFAMFLLVGTWVFAPSVVTGQPVQPPDKKKASISVGEIIIVGDSTPDDVIRKALKLFPGQTLDDKALRAAEKNLETFKATIEVIETKDAKFKDILITLKKKDDAAKESTLEQQIAEALKNNPDIQVAEAKLHTAEAELRRVRMRVASEISTLRAEIHAAQAALEEGEDRYQRARLLHAKGSISLEDLAAAKLTKLKLAGELAFLQAKLPLLLGTHPGGSATSRLLDEIIRKKWNEPIKDTLTPPPVNQESPQHEKLRKALDMPAHFPNVEISLVDLMEYIRDKGLGFNTVIRVKSLKKDKLKIQLVTPIPLGAAFQYIEDEFDVVFILRDYGIVVVGAMDRLPPDAVRLIDFWKRGMPPGAPKKDAPPK